jgi:hypothetical protein
MLADAHQQVDSTPTKDARLAAMKPGSSAYEAKKRFIGILKPV